MEANASKEGFLGVVVPGVCGQQLRLDPGPSPDWFPAALLVPGDCAWGEKTGMCQTRKTRFGTVCSCGTIVTLHVSSVTDQII